MGGGTITYSYRTTYKHEWYMKNRELLKEQRRLRKMEKKGLREIPEILINAESNQ